MKRDDPSTARSRLTARRKGFTLVELLVVVTIIALLVAMILPAMEGAYTQAKTAKCLANLHAIGQGMELYLGDHQRTYPVVSYWHSLLGKRGHYEPGRPPNDYPFLLDVTDRPLNRYLGYASNGSEVPVAECPADLGDPLFTGSPQAYRTFGTSYITLFFRYSLIEPVFGKLANAGTPYAQDSWKSTQVERTDNKVILPDWVTLWNRKWEMTNTRWHSPGSAANADTRYHSTLFADSHAELFGYELTIFEVLGNTQEPGDPSRPWW